MKETAKDKTSSKARAKDIPKISISTPDTSDSRTAMDSPIKRESTPIDPSNNLGEGSASKSSRRHHKKSRKGCATCKKRRVKCDETHPICKNCENLGLECSFSVIPAVPYTNGNLNMMDLRLFYHYTTEVFKTIAKAGIQTDQIWGTDVPMLAFDYPFLMHAILTFSATHFSRTSKGIPENVVTLHRGEALKLLGEEVRNVSPANLDSLVAASILLILDSLANASMPDTASLSSLPASAWLHHVRGAATILISISPLPPESRFYSLVNIDLSDLADPSQSSDTTVHFTGVSTISCFDDDLTELYPVHTTSPYFQTLIYLDKLVHQRFKSDFILRVFSFPALLDRNLLELLIQGDDWAKRIIKVYYKLVRSFVNEMKDSVWFLEGVAKVLPIDTDSELGGLGFIASALPLQIPSSPMSLDKVLEFFDAGGLLEPPELSPLGGGEEESDNQLDLL